jgi:hypothetical protein
MTQLSAQSRINELENTVNMLINKFGDQPLNLKPHSTDGSATGGDGLNDNLGRMNLDAEGANYVEASHWSAILDNVRHF